MEKVVVDGGRTKRLSVRVSPEEYEKIRESAKVYGLPVAVYLRASGVGALPQKRKYADGAKRSGKGALLLLRNISILSSLDDEELLKTLDRISVKRFRGNEVVLIQEDANRYMYLILEGRVKVIRVSEEGKEIILALHRTGDFFGEMSLIDGGAVSATVMAADDSTIAIISKDNFYALLNTQKKIFLNLLHTFCGRIRSSNRTIEILSHTSASHRIKMLFLMLCEKHGKRVNGDVVLAIRMTHRDIADMSGLTRETVTKIMSELKEAGAISVHESRQIRLNKAFFT